MRTITCAMMICFNKYDQVKLKVYKTFFLIANAFSLTLNKTAICHVSSYHDELVILLVKTYQICQVTPTISHYFNLPKDARP